MESAKVAGSTVFNKILIPVITTVLGATAIYFLGFNKKNTGRTDMEQMLISKEATVKAWKSFVTTQNIYYKNAKSISEEYTVKMGDVIKQAQGYAELVPVFRDFEKDLSKESKKTTQDVENIVKDKDIDRDFLSMLNRILENSKDYDNKLADFFDTFASLARSDRSETEKKEKITAEIQRFTDMEKRVSDRVTNESEGIAKVLAERYNQAFNLNELDVYVDYKKENKNATTGANTNTNNNTPAILAPPDPNKGIEYTEKTQDDNKAASGNSNNSGNETEPTASLLTGQWVMTGGVLELSKNGVMFWVFEGKGYTSGDWKLVDGKLRMNATNPDTDQTSHLIGFLSNVTRNSFTLTFMTSPKEVYDFRKKNY